VRADLIIIDVPLKPEEALSQTQRRAANEWFDQTLYSRLNDKFAGAIVLIMHRLHEDDLVGHVLAQEDWEVVSFPAIAENDETQLVDDAQGRTVGGGCSRPDRRLVDGLCHCRYDAFCPSGGRRSGCRTSYRDLRQHHHRGRRREWL
jgi:hypothetical protein